MARIRKFVAYRTVERPYTRVSKYRKKGFVKARPASKLLRFVQGDKTAEFTYKAELIAKTDLQIRNNALEAARQSGNRLMEKLSGKNGYRFMVRKYPHHILRENPLASGAGADRLSTGMKHSFGKAIGSAAQVRKGDAVLEIRMNKQHIDAAKKSLKRCAHKLPNSYMVQVTELEPTAKAPEE